MVPQPAEVSTVQPRSRPGRQTLLEHHSRDRRPESIGLAVVALAWLAMVLPGLASMPGTDPMPGMPGQSGSIVPHALVWLLVMTVATMGPAALGGLRHAGMTGRTGGRWPWLAGYATGYLAVWLAFGLLALMVSTELPRLTGFPVTGHATPCLVLLVAAGWQFTPYKRRWLREAHRSMPPTRTALSFGTRSGLACLGSCWCLMLLMNAAPGAGLLCCLSVSGIATTERLLSRPARATRLAGVGLGIAGLWTLILGIG